jgi:HK97 family phage portal protein
LRNPLRALFERRSGINSPHDLLEYLTKGMTSKAGSTVNENTALNVAAVMTCVSLISRTIATLPIGIFERLDARNKQRATSHPLAKVFAKPNGWQTRAEFAQMMQTHLLLRGNAYAWLNWGVSAIVNGEPQYQLLEMVPLHPDRVTVKQRDSWTLDYTLTQKDGTPIPLVPDSVLHLRGLSTDGVMGRSVLADAREVIGGAIATQDHSSNFWKRDGTPTVALRHPKTLGADGKVAENLRKQWEELYSGADRSRVAVLEEGMEIQQLSINAEDAQFLETRKFQRSEIAGWFHVPPHMIGDTEKSTSWGTGIEQQQIGFLTFTIRPWLVAWEQRLNLDLMINPQRFFIEFNVDGLLRGDIGSRYTAYDKGIRGGWLSPNDVRALENMNPIEDGDTYLQPTNMAPLGTEPPAPGASA